MGQDVHPRTALTWLLSSVVFKEHETSSALWDNVREKIREWNLESMYVNPMEDYSFTPTWTSVIHIAMEAFLIHIAMEAFLQVALSGTIPWHHSSTLCSTQSITRGCEANREEILREEILAYVSPNSVLQLAEAKSGDVLYRTTQTR